MKNHTDYFSFVYRASVNSENQLVLPDQWKALTCSRYFAIKAVDGGSVLFTPSMEKPKEELLFVNEKNALENISADPPEDGSCYWAGLGDEFLLIRHCQKTGPIVARLRDYYDTCFEEDAPCWEDVFPKVDVPEDPVRIPSPCCRPAEKRALSRIFGPHAHCSGLHSAIKGLQRIENEYSLFAIALSHPDIVTAGLAAAALDNRLLLTKLAELCIHEKDRRKIGMYAAFRLGSRMTAKLKATEYNGFLKVLSGHYILPAETGFRLKNMVVLHGPGYWRNCLSECKYEDRAVKKIRHMTNPVSAMAFSAAEPFRDVYEEFLFLARERQDMIFWSALFGDSDPRCLLATRYLDYRFLKIAAIACNHEDRWRDEGFGWVPQQC